jgi:RNA polymerase sigma-70 factor (sigma-E family)
VDVLTDPSARVVDFDEWVAARGVGLIRLAYVLTGNRHDAEDLVQDVLARALPRWSRIAVVENPEAYLRRMLVNAHTSAWRRFRRRETPVAALVDIATKRVDEPDVIEHLHVWQACLALPRDQRIAVVLRFYEDMDYGAIAELTGVRVGSVRSRVSRALASMRQELNDG